MHFSWLLKRKSTQGSIRPTGSSPQFYTWLQKHSSVMKHFLTKEARRNAGFDATEKITNNRVESVNHVLKEIAKYEEMSLPGFIALSKAVGESRWQQKLKAEIRKGKYRFKEEFTSHEIAESKRMYEMNQDQQERHLCLVMKTKLDASRGPNQATSLLISPLSALYSQLTHSRDCPLLRVE